jgi:hypothetical protein
VVAGLAITPAPLSVIPVAITAGRIATKYGHRILVVPGGLVISGASVMMLLRAGPEAAYLSVWIPSSLCVGVGSNCAYPYSRVLPC